MSAHIPVTRQSLGRTFVVAATVLGVIGAAEIGRCAGNSSNQLAWWEMAQDARLPQIDVQRLMSEMPPPDAPLAVSNDPLEPDPVAVGPTGVRPVPVATPLDPKSASREEEDKVLASVVPTISTADAGAALGADAEGESAVHGIDRAGEVAAQPAGIRRGRW
jgi:hypothetical protein